MPPTRLSAATSPTIREALQALVEQERADRKARDLERLEQRLRGGLARYWKAQRNALLDGMDRLRRHFTESADDDFDRLWSTVEDIDDGALAELVDDLDAEAMQRGAQSAALDLGLAAALEITHPEAVRFLRNRGAELVTRIDETTRRQMRGVLTRGLEDGRSYADVADEISRRFRGFSDRSVLGHIRTRAELVAVQELGVAYEHAHTMLADDLTRAGYQLERSMVIAGDDRTCPDCLDADAAGWIPHGQLFPSGVIGAPVHVGCRCATATRPRRGTPTIADLPGGSAFAAV